MFDDAASNAVVDWLERLSQNDGYDEAGHLRRAIIDAHTGGMTWDSMDPAAIGAGLTAWLGRKRFGGVDLPQLPDDATAAAAAEIAGALTDLQKPGNSPAMLSVDEYGCTLQALWSALRGGDTDAPEPEPTPNGKGFRADFKLNG